MGLGSDACCIFSPYTVSDRRSHPSCIARPARYADHSTECIREAYFSLIQKRTARDPSLPGRRQAGTRHFRSWTRGKPIHHLGRVSNVPYPALLRPRIPWRSTGFYESRIALGQLRISDLSSSRQKPPPRGHPERLRRLPDFLVVHSLGGILVKAAIANLVLRRDQKAGAALNKIDALIMMATPQDGSLWFPPFFSWITEDAGPPLTAPY